MNHRPSATDPVAAATAHDGRVQDGIPIGNQIDKSQLTNPLARRLVAGFDHALFSLIASLRPHPASVHEVGCGEGRLTRLLRDHLKVPVHATDFSREIIQENQSRAHEGIHYEARSIYELQPDRDGAGLIVCCEVLEHLEDPTRGLAALRRLGAAAYILSVPREPLWRVLNMARGQYLRTLGNTPGHLNHWSVRGFEEFLSAGGFRVEKCLQPLPWTMVRGGFR